jgi:hypothetical protein
LQGFSVPAGEVVPARRQPVIDVQVGLHVFMIVLIFGTLWRISQFHLMASPNPSLQHLGKAMSIQY